MSVDTKNIPVTEVGSGDGKEFFIGTTESQSWCYSKEAIEITLKMTNKFVNDYGGDYILKESMFGELTVLRIINGELYITDVELDENEVIDLNDNGKYNIPDDKFEILTPERISSEWTHGDLTLPLGATLKIYQ